MGKYRVGTRADGDNKARTISGAEKFDVGGNEIDCGRKRSKLQRGRRLAAWSQLRFEISFRVESNCACDVVDFSDSRTLY